MTRATVKAHARKGTKGVRKHARTVPRKRKVPHNTARPLIFSGEIEGQKFKTYIKYKGRRINKLAVHEITPMSNRAKGLYDRIDLYIYEVKLPDRSVFVAKYDSYMNPLTGGFANYTGKDKAFDTFNEARGWLRKETKTKVKDMDFTTTYTPQKDGVERFGSIPAFLQFDPIR